MKSFITAIIVLALNLTALAQSSQVRYTNVKFLNTVKSSTAIQYRYSIYKLPTQTYAYVIFANDEKYLHQDNMPGKPAGVGFSTEEGAKKVAQLVVKRLELPVVPPRVSTVEMEYLGVN